MAAENLIKILQEFMLGKMQMTAELIKNSWKIPLSSAFGDKQKLIFVGKEISYLGIFTEIRSEFLSEKPPASRFGNLSNSC